jgi:hypothetical protein
MAFTQLKQALWIFAAGCSVTLAKDLGQAMATIIATIGGAHLLADLGQAAQNKYL